MSSDATDTRESACCGDGEHSFIKLTESTEINNQTGVFFLPPGDENNVFDICLFADDCVFILPFKGLSF